MCPNTLALAEQTQTQIHQATAARADELASLLRLLNSGRGMPAHTAIDGQVLDNLLILAGRLADEVVSLLTDD
jgi:hypothetical protein